MEKWSDIVLNLLLQTKICKENKEFEIHILHLFLSLSNDLYYQGEDFHSISYKERKNAIITMKTLLD